MHLSILHFHFQYTETRRWKDLNTRLPYLVQKCIRDHLLSMQQKTGFHRQLFLFQFHKEYPLSKGVNERTKNYDVMRVQTGSKYELHM